MKIFLVIILLISVGLCTQAGAKVKMSPIDKQIIELTFNADLAQADSLLDAQIQKNPRHPKYYAMKAPFYFYTRYFSRNRMPNDSLLQLVADNAQKAIDVGKKMEKTTEIKFYLGSAYGMLSRAQVMQGNYWDAYWSAWDCEDYLEEVLEEDPSFADAYLGLGVMEYFTAIRLNWFYTSIAWVSGMAGDRETGLEYFQKVADQGVLLQEEATFILAMMHRYVENDPVTAFPYISKLRDKYPQNQFIANQREQMYLAKLVEEKGVEFLKIEIDSLITRYNINNAAPLNGVGYFLVNRERLDDALTVFQVNLKLFPDVANCYDSLAECYMIRGNDEMAIKYYKIAYEKLSSDQSINDIFRERLKTGIEDKLKELGAEINT